MRILAIAATALLFTASAAFPAVDQGLLNLVPPGARLVSGIQLESSRNSPLGRFLLARTQSDNTDLQQFIANTGFDPRRDVQQAIFASSGDRQNSSFAVIARGYFDVAKIRAAAVSKGAHVQLFQGIPLILNKEKKQIGVAFLDSTLAVLADQATLEQIVAARSTPTVLDKDLEDRIERMSASHDAWFVSLVSGSQLPIGIIGHHSTAATGSAPSAGNPQKEAFQSILQSSGGIQFGDDIHVNLDALTRSDKDATSLADVCRFFASVVQMQRDNKDPRAAILAKALDGMVLQTEGANLHLSLTLPEKAAEQLLQPVPTQLKQASNQH